MKKIFIIPALAVALLASCTENNEILRPRKSSSNKISVDVLGSSGASTKASFGGDGTLFDSFVLDSIGGQLIKIDAYVSDYCPLPEPAAMQTKGAIITADSLKNIDGAAFTLDAYALADWHDNASPSTTHLKGSYFSETVSFDDPDWVINGSPEWLNEIGLSFWSWKGVKPVASGDNYNQASFEYTNDSQKDLVYAFNAEKRIFNDKGEITEGSGTYSTTAKQRIAVNFSHALSAVRFDVSDLMEDDLEIKKITISGVVATATCNITTSANATGGGYSVSYDWPSDDFDGTASFTQEFTEDDFDATSLDGTTANAMMSMSSDKFFFFIPQQIKDQGVKIKITYENDKGEELTSETTLAHETNWEAGKYYTYKIHAAVVDLVLSGSLPSPTVKNTGNVAEFLRVVFVGNWCVLDNTSTPATITELFDCPPEDITLKGFNTTTNDSYGGHWELNSSDGYYYYSKAVEPGVSIPLITGYEVSNDHKVDGTEFILTVSGQAVAKGRASNWSEAATVD